MDKDRLISPYFLSIISFISLIILFLLNLDVLFSFITGDDGESVEYFNENLSESFNEALYFIDTQIITPDVGTFILWGLIGMFCYVVVGAIINFISDIVLKHHETQYNKHPKYYDKQKVILLFTIKVVLYVILLLALVGIFITFFYIFLPFSASSLEIALFSSTMMLSKFLYFFLSYVSIFLFIFTCWILLRSMQLLRQSTLFE